MKPCNLDAAMWFPVCQFVTKKEMSLRIHNHYTLRIRKKYKNRCYTGNTFDESVKLKNWEWKYWSIHLYISRMCLIFQMALMYTFSMSHACKIQKCRSKTHENSIYTFSMLTVLSVTHCQILSSITRVDVWHAMVTDVEHTNIFCIEEFFPKRLNLMAQSCLWQDKSGMNNHSTRQNPVT